MKLLFIGDIHFRATSPRNRKDDYLNTLEAKLLECWEIAKRYNVQAILQPGDVFHSPEVSIPTLLKAVEIFNRCPVPFYTTPGNHDLHGYNLDSYGRTSLRLLDMLCERLYVGLSDEHQTGDDTTNITFQPYTSSIDTSDYLYRYLSLSDAFTVNVRVIHSMLLDHDLPYEARYTNLYNLETNADIILSGHDHCGYGVIKRQDGKLFVNPGALMRLTASEAEMNRTVQVAIIDTETRTAELVPLTTAKPAVEVLDRSKLEEKKERLYAMEDFAALIKTTDGQAVMNLDEIITNIGKQEAIPDEVVRKAIHLLREVKT